MRGGTQSAKGTYEEKGESCEQLPLLLDPGCTGERVYCLGKGICEVKNTNIEVHPLYDSDPLILTVRLHSPETDNVGF